MSVPDFADWQSQNQAFEQMAGFVSGGSLLISGDETERVRGDRSQRGLLSALPHQRPYGTRARTR